ncbi:MAG: deoxyguanosinetriphosphate triphosphohydrolase, partial [Oscillospiraceae bacterium]|nr:deoxyguanosinetriphosphate triphosphohydrolase [Oscillospiraceae bacterium]
HTHGAPDDTREATCVRLADRIAYINHDLDDAVRAGILTNDRVPMIVRRNCGSRNSERINAFITDLINNSADGEIKFSPMMQETFDTFHSFMYSDVYTNPAAKSEESKVEGILGGIYDYYKKNPWKLPNEMLETVSREGLDRAVCDYVSGMTDGYAMEKYGKIFIPAAWTVK